MSQLSILRVGSEDLLQLGDVVADARRAPHVVRGVDIAGIVDGEPLGHDRPGVGEVRQLRLVELLEDIGLDLALQEIGRGHHDVVAGLAGHQARLQRLVGVEGVVDHLDAGLLGEGLQDIRRHVVGPVVEVDDALLGGRLLRGECQRCGDRETKAKTVAADIRHLGPTSCVRAPRPTTAPAQCRASGPSWQSRSAPPSSPGPARRTPRPGSPRPCSPSRCASRTRHRSR